MSGVPDDGWQAARFMLPRAKHESWQATLTPASLILLSSSLKFDLMDVRHVPSGRHLPSRRARRIFRRPARLFLDPHFVRSLLADAISPDDAELCIMGCQVKVMDLEGDR
jgi:hypothetical protein